MKQNILLTNPSFLISSSSLFCLYLRHNNFHNYVTIHHHQIHHQCLTLSSNPLSIINTIIDTIIIIESITIFYHYQVHPYHEHHSSTIDCLFRERRFDCLLYLCYSSLSYSTGIVYLPFGVKSSSYAT